MIRLFLISIATGLGLGIGFALPIIIAFFVWKKNKGA